MSANPSSSPLPNQRARRRRIGLAVVTLVVLAGAAAWGVWWTTVGSHFVSTDNAYVQGNLVQITPQVGGTVLAVHAEDTDRVEAGQLLVALDPADARVALDQAQAQLGQTVREVQSTYANNATLRANIALREADVVRARAEVARTGEDVRRREGLQATGAVSGEEMQHARSALDAARSALVASQAAVQAAREQLAANLALTAGTPVDEHPNVQRAAAQVREAWLTLQRSTVQAPVTGYVARRNVQIGQRIQAGQPLMSIIPLDQLWVEANFKEVQLRDMRIGQPVKLSADLYGSRVSYEGRITGLGAGTGAAFALLPAQNATGNWIKVVQRVPVRIALDPRQVAEHPLRVGLSMEAEVDITRKDGASLANAPRKPPLAPAQASSGVPDEADAIVRRVIAANLGRAATPASAAQVTGRAGADTAAAATASAAPIPDAATAPTAPANTTATKNAATTTAAGALPRAPQ